MIQRKEILVGLSSFPQLLTPRYLNYPLSVNSFRKTYLLLVVVSPNSAAVIMDIVDSTYYRRPEVLVPETIGLEKTNLVPRHPRP